MEKLTREQMITLVDRVMRADLPEAEYGPAQEALTRSTGNPHVFNLIFWPADGQENLSAEEIVDEALSYRPIEL